jgi:hypothetical protein
MTIRPLAMKRRDATGARPNVADRALRNDYPINQDKETRRRGDNEKRLQPSDVRAMTLHAIRLVMKTSVPRTTANTVRS